MSRKEIKTTYIGKITKFGNGAHIKCYKKFIGEYAKVEVMRYTAEDDKLDEETADLMIEAARKG